MALDIKQTGVLRGLPLQFSGSNLVKSIRAGTPQDTQNAASAGGSDGRWQNPGGEATERANYTVVFTINADAPPPPPPPVVVKRADPPPVMPSRTTTSGA